VQKAARAGLAMVVAGSGATSLAVAAAEDVGMTLVGFVRGTSCAIYSGPERVVPG
jgi:FdhD protein